MDLQNKIAFITGAAQGIGKSCAEILLQRGVKVFCGDVNPTVGAATLTELGEKYGTDNVRFAHLDVNDSARFTEVFNQAVSEFGRVDVMVNNAGVLNEFEWQPMISTNITAVVHGTLLATEHMRKDKGGRGGRIVNISSSSALADFMNAPIYCGTKHAVRAFTSSMAMRPDIIEQGVEYATLCPHATDTPLARGMGKLHLGESLKTAMVNALMPASNIAEGLLELLVRDDMNGRILLVEKTGKTYKKVVAVDADQ